jgi:hypothetical protein
LPNSALESCSINYPCLLDASFNKYILSFYYVLDAILRTGADFLLGKEIIMQYTCLTVTSARKKNNGEKRDNEESQEKGRENLTDKRVTEAVQVRITDKG